MGPAHEPRRRRRAGWLPTAIGLMSCILYLALTGCQTSQAGAPPGKGFAATPAATESRHKIHSQFGKKPLIPELGVKVDNIYSLDRELWIVAEREFAIDRRLQVIDVLPNSPAAAAGLQPGDLLVQIGSTHIPKSENAYDFLAASVVPNIRWGQRTPILVLRNGTARQLALP